MKVEIVTMTPELAAELLARNTKNRTVARASVAALARDMANGAWQVNGDTIRIAKDGLVLDGQHRMLACMQSGVSYEALIVSDLDEDVRSTIDVGRGRSMGDELSIEGHKSANMLAAALRGVMLYLLDAPYGGSWKPTNQELLQTLDALVAAEVPMDILTTMVRPVARVISGGSVLAVMALTYSQSGDYQEEFCGRVADGSDLSAGDPRLALRNAMLTIKARTSGRGLHTPEALRAVTITWNAWHSGRSLKTVKISQAANDRWLRILGAPAPGAGLEALARPFNGRNPTGRPK
jgi:hypothetical protein